MNFKNYNYFCNTIKPHIMILKKYYLLFLLFLSSICFSQDIILKKNGDEVKAKNIEIASSEIKYNLFNSSDSIFYILNKTDVFMIKYQNGSKQVFNVQDAVAVEPTQNTTTAPKPTFTQGVNDANRYYKKYIGAGTGNFIGGFFLGICALPIPIATGSSSPQESNLGYPNPGLFDNSDYRNGYISRAKKIKQNKVWTNWAVGCVAGSTVGLLVNLALRK